MARIGSCKGSHQGQQVGSQPSKVLRSMTLEGASAWACCSGLGWTTQGSGHMLAAGADGKLAAVEGCSAHDRAAAAGELFQGI